MNRTSLVALTATLGLLASAAFAADLPTRKPGLWEMTVQNSNAKDKPTVMQQCIDATTDKQMQQFGQGMSQKMCSKSEIRNEGGRFVTESVCKMGASTITSKGTLTGNFNSAYRVESRATYDPPVMNMTEANMIVDAKWLGACKADQKPGDMIMPGGMKMNINQMQQMQGAKK